MQVTRARVQDLDARNAQLHAELHGVRSGAQQQAEAMQRTQADLAHVREVRTGAPVKSHGEYHGMPCLYCAKQHRDSVETGFYHRSACCKKRRQR